MTEAILEGLGLDLSLREIELILERMATAPSPFQPTAPTDSPMFVVIDSNGERIEL